MGGSVAGYDGSVAGYDNTATGTGRAALERPAPDASATAVSGLLLAQEPPAGDVIASDVVAGDVVAEELLVEEISIDGMCGVY